MGSPKPKKTEKPPLSELDKVKAELVKVKDELKSYKKKAETEKAALAEVDVAALKVESCKNRTASAKEELADAQKQLAAIVRGDAQQEHPALTVKGSPAQVRLYSVPKDQQIGEKDHGLKAADLQGKMIAKLIKASKPASITPDAVVAVKGSLYLVRDSQPEVAPSRFFAQQVVTLDEWQQLYEKEFGRNVLGFDQGDDAMAQRQKGGEDCGRTVLIGRKKYVLAPERVGIVLICESEEMKPQTTSEKPTGKDAAAGSEPPELNAENQDGDEAEED